MQAIIQKNSTHGNKNILARKFKISNESGAGIVYFIFLAAISSVVIFELQRRSNQETQLLRIEKQKRVRDSLYERINSLVRLEEALYVSSSVPPFAATNQLLKNCLTQGASCTSLNPNRMQPFSLINPTGLKPVTGTQSSPVRYDRDGQPCAQDCFFEARSYFWASCPAAAAMCPVPERVHVLTQIKFVGASGQAAARLADYPTDQDLTAQATNLSQSMLVSDILRFLQGCPPGSMLVELEKSGKARCECIGGSQAQVGTDERGLPICSQKNCPPNETFVGLDKDRNPICAQRDDEYSCFRKAINMQNNTVDCGKDTFGQPIRIKGLYNTDGACRIQSNGAVLCDPIEAVCCVRVPKPY
jgi:hypothetical protein